MRMKERKKFRWVALKLCLVLLAIFILQIIFPAITENFSLTASEVWEKPWLLLSAIFLHGSITHLLFNLFSLFLFGSFLERKIGAGRFIFVFLLTGIVASVAASFFYSSSLGASGAIYGAIGALVVISPFMPAFALGVPMPLIVAVIIWMLADIAGFSSFLQGTPGGIANAAHIAGLFSGIALGIVLRKGLRERKMQER